MSLQFILMNTNQQQVSQIKLQVGDKAPLFESQIQNPDGTVESFNLDKTLEAGNKVLLVFYPGDDTPGCTAQLCGIRDVYSEYKDLGVKVIGINHGNGQSHLKFIQKYHYQFGIIIDQDKNIRHSYGAEKTFFKNITTKRSVFLIDTDQKILFIHWGQQDNQQILDLLKK